MSQTSYQAALPHVIFLLYQRLVKKSSFFSEKLTGGEFDEVIVVINGVGSAGEFEDGEFVAQGEGEFGR